MLKGVLLTSSVKETAHDGSASPDAKKVCVPTVTHGRAGRRAHGYRLRQCVAGPGARQDHGAQPRQTADNSDVGVDPGGAAGRLRPMAAAGDGADPSAVAGRFAYDRPGRDAGDAAGARCPGAHATASAGDG